MGRGCCGDGLLRRGHHRIDRGSRLVAVARSLHEVGNILDRLVSAAGPKKGIYLGIAVLGHTTLSTLFPLHGGNMRMGAAPLVS